eukprot:2481037-Pyramimonas_sp.AAC.1
MYFAKYPLNLLDPASAYSSLPWMNVFTLVTRLRQAAAHSCTCGGPRARKSTFSPARCRSFICLDSSSYLSLALIMSCVTPPLASRSSHVW